MIYSVGISDFQGILGKEFSPLGRYQAIIGENGSGKTHILEAIHLLSGGSFRSGRRPGSEDFSVHLSYEEAIGTKIYGIQKRDGKTKYHIQGGTISGKKYQESLPFRSVFIGPFDMNLLYFSPSLRRDYIDDILERTFTQFRSVRKDYELCMRQRNSLLKRIRDGDAQRKDLEYWDKVFSEKADLYALYRAQWIEALTREFSILEAYLSRYTLGFKYESSYFHEPDRKEYIKSYLEGNRERDILTGHTHIGPHLDDFVFEIQKNNTSFEASTYLSRGETKMLLLGLKQIEVLFLKKNLETAIILLIDDLFAELDMKHTEKVIEKFDVNQIIVTTQRSLPIEEKWKYFSCINLSPG